MFGTESDDETSYVDWIDIGLESTEETSDGEYRGDIRWKVQRRHQMESTEETSEPQSVGDDSIEVAESDMTNEGEQLQ